MHIRNVRILLNDFADTNILKEEEFSDEDIERALEIALEDFNEAGGRRTYYTPDDMPYTFCLYLGTIVELLRKALNKELTLPQVSLPFGTLQTRVERLQQMLEVTEQLYRLVRDNIKHNLNVISGFGAAKGQEVWLWW